MTLTPLEKGKLDFYLRRVGRISADEALRIAVEAEDFASQVGVHDFTYPKFSSDAKHFFEYALLLEKEAA